MAQKREIKSIVVLGDSVAKGVVFNAEKRRYIFSKEGFIKTLADKLKGSVQNLAKFGMTSSHGQKLLTDRVHEIDPDLVLIEYGGNDCDYDWDAVAQDPTLPHQPNTPPLQFARQLHDMVMSVHRNGKVPVLMNLPPLHAQRYFDWFTQQEPTRVRNIRTWLGDVSKIYWWQEKYSYLIEHVARQTQTRLIDVRGAFLSLPRYSDYICVDGIHPNEAGQALIDRAFTAYIRQNAAHILNPV